MAIKRSREELIEFLSNCFWPFDSKAKMKEYAESFLQIADNNNGEDMYIAARIYHNGTGVSTNYFKALQYAKQSANCGYPRAYYVLGHMYRMGNGVARDAEKAMVLFQQGMDMGDEECFNCYNSMLKNGNLISNAKRVAELLKEIGII